MKNKKLQTVLGVIALFVLLCTLLQSCIKDAERTVPVSNSEFKVELLFEVDGCKVYRFTDNGHFYYFSNCKNSAVTWKQYNVKTSVSRTIETR